MTPGEWASYVILSVAARAMWEAQGRASWRTRGCLLAWWHTLSAARDEVAGGRRHREAVLPIGGRA